MLLQCLRSPPGLPRSSLVVFISASRQLRTIRKMAAIASDPTTVRATLRNDVFINGAFEKAEGTFEVRSDCGKSPC